MLLRSSFWTFWTHWLAAANDVTIPAEAERLIIASLGYLPAYF
jgi:hypothetical protein